MLLRGLRDKKNGNLANLNQAIIINSAFVAESLVYDMVKLTLEPKVDTSIEGRSIRCLLNSAKSGSWTKLVQVFETTFDSKINTAIDLELWKDVKHLFGFRNHLVHGKPMIIENDIEGSFEYSESKLKRLNQFILERDLSELGQSNSPSAGLINSKVADYFWTSAKSFCFEVSEKFSDDNNKIVNEFFKAAIARAEA